MANRVGWGFFFLEIEICTNLRRLCSNTYIFFQSKLATLADKSLYVTCHIFLPFPLCWTMPLLIADATCQPCEEKLYTFIYFRGFVPPVYLVAPSSFPVLGKNILFKLQHYEKIQVRQ